LSYRWRGVQGSPDSGQAHVRQEKQNYIFYHPKNDRVIF